MKNKDRQRLETNYTKLYEKITPAKHCIYCGDPFECFDHVPPLSALERINIDTFIEKGGKLSLLPSCYECNRLLSNKVILELSERRAYLIDKYGAEDGGNDFGFGWELSVMATAFEEAEKAKLKYWNKKLKGVLKQAKCRAQ